MCTYLPNTSMFKSTKINNNKQFSLFYLLFCMCVYEKERTLSDSITDFKGKGPLGIDSIITLKDPRIKSRFLSLGSKQF